jgi:glycosyltransferase involved in cell wall biosynthesis
MINQAPAEIPDTSAPVPRPNGTVGPVALADRVFVFQVCIPNYRRKVFELLSDNDDSQFTFIAGDVADPPGLELLETAGAGVRFRLARARFIPLGGGRALSLQPRALSIVIRDRPDLIVAGGNPYWLTTWGLLLLGRILSIPVLLWSHGLNRPERGPKWWIRRSLYRLASGMMLYGDTARELLANRGFDLANLHVIHNSLDVEGQRRATAGIGAKESAAVRARLGIRPNDALVVFAGRVEPAKRLDLLLSATAQLAERARRVHLAIVGDGETRKVLGSMAADLGVSQRVHWLGPIYDDRELARIFRAGDLCVIPGFAGLAIVHAMGFETPVLISDDPDNGPEQEAVVEGVTGYVFQNGDAEDLAQKIEDAIFITRCKERMKSACIAMAQDRYSPRSHAEAFFKATRATLARRRAVARDRIPNSPGNEAAGAAPRPRPNPIAGSDSGDIGDADNGQ